MTGPRHRLLKAAALLALAMPGLILPVQAPAGALELRGRTYFEKAPWRITFRNYYSTVFQSGGEYYFTIEMPESAGAGLGALEIRQTAGVDWQFSFDVSRTRAFLGQPRREGPALPIEADFDDERRQFRIRFSTPPGPGQTVTVALRPYRNPAAADLYQFAVTAEPAGADPVPQAVGFARMPIYNSLDY